MPPQLTELLQGLEVPALCLPQGTFNCVLAEKYRDGEDHVSWHTDTQKRWATGRPSLAPAGS